MMSMYIANPINVYQGLSQSICTHYCLKMMGAFSRYLRCNPAKFGVAMREMALILSRLEETLRMVGGARSRPRILLPYSRPR